MSVFKEFRAKVKKAVEELPAVISAPEPVDLSRFVVEAPRDPEHGDLATNAALVLAKPLKTSPRDLALALSDRLVADADVAKADVAGPGFLNLTLDEGYWQRSLIEALARADDFGRSGIGAEKKVNVEYVSANPTGPMHVGHCRGAVFGDALASLLAFTGHNVVREYYINDAGAQVDALARSVYRRYLEALGEDPGPMPEGLYPGDYLVPVGESVAAEHGLKLLDLEETGWLPILRDASVAAMMDLIKADLAALNIHHDVFFSEASLHGADGDIAQMIGELRNRSLVYEGRLPPPKGQLPEDWEDRDQTLFRATSFGDDVDRPLKKSDDSYTYFAADVAYFRSKFLRGFNQMIYVLGADHGGYVKRLQAVGEAISGGKAEVIVRLCQLVKLYRAGEPVRMSKRAGQFVTLRAAVDEVGPDAVRFMMLYRKNDAPLDFDFVKVTEQSKDNPVFYVQYAHARAHSVFRQAREAFPDIVLPISTPHVSEACLSRVNDTSELSILRKIAAFPELLENAALAHEPHRVAFYLYELASEFHALWNKGKDLPYLRFIQTGDEQLTLARLALVQGVAVVLANGLNILGVNAPQEM